MEQEKKEKPLKDKKKNNEEILKLQEEIKNLNDELLRVKADLINYRKRKDEETSNMLKYVNKDILENLLPVIDNFERAISLDDSNLTDELSNFLTGFKMIYASFKSILEGYGVKEIECLGKEFDSNVAQAVLTDSDDNFDDGIVLDVLMKGYMYKDKVLRHASVKVNNKNI